MPRVVAPLTATNSWPGFGPGRRPRAVVMVTRAPSTSCPGVSKTLAVATPQPPWASLVPGVAPRSAFGEIDTLMLKPEAELGFWLRLGPLQPSRARPTTNTTETARHSVLRIAPSPLLPVPGRGTAVNLFQHFQSDFRADVETDLGPTEGLQEHERHSAVARLLVAAQGVPHGPGRRGREPRGKVHRLEERDLAVGGALLDQPEAMGETGGDRHPDRDRFAVPPRLVAAERLQGMPDRVPV